MAKNRKAAEKVILDVIDSICPGNPNVQIYKEMFNPDHSRYLSNKGFDDWMNRLREGKGALVYIDPLGTKYKLDVNRNLNELGPKYNINFFQRIWYKDDNGDWFLTPNSYLIIPLPVRRQSQLLTKKISIPENNYVIDDYTGQVTGDSKGSSISYQELSILKSFGLKKSIEEFMHWRGGDVKGNRILNQMVQRTGGASMDALKPYAGEVKSTETLKSILLGMHLDNNL